MGLMDLFRKKTVVGTALITFYDLSHGSVVYITDVDEPEQKADDFGLLTLMYYSKILYNMNVRMESTQLIADVGKAVSRMVERISDDVLPRMSILPNSLTLSEPLPAGGIKSYSGKLLRLSGGGRVVEMDGSRGDEYSYTPRSVLLLIQHLINVLPEQMVAFYVVALGGMNRYYDEFGDYSNPRSMLEAPSFGIQMAYELAAEASSDPAQTLS